MNKKLFDTRLNSVKHYLKEIEDLKNAHNTTKETLGELVSSFVEFISFKPGDIISLRTQVFAVDSVIGTFLTDGVLKVRIKVLYPKRNGGYEKGDYGSEENIEFKYLDEIKIIYSKPDEQ